MSSPNSTSKLMNTSGSTNSRRSSLLAGVTVLVVLVLVAAAVATLWFVMMDDGPGMGIFAAQGTYYIKSVLRVCDSYFTRASTCIQHSDAISVA